MYRQLPETSGNVRAYAIEGDLDRSDVEAMQDDLRAAADDHGRLRVLVDLTGLDTMEQSAVWQDLQMTPEYLDIVERLAVLGDERWHEWSARASNLAVDAAAFGPDDRRSAWAWVRADDDAGEGAADRTRHR
jgi:hypothetical protein